MYYTFHGDDARYVAKHVYETTSVIQYWYGDHTTGLPTTKLTNKAAESFLRDLLLNKHMRIEIWKWSQAGWQVIRKASPGNLQDVEDFLFSSTNMTSAPVVLAIKYMTSDDQKVSQKEKERKREHSTIHIYTACRRSFCRYHHSSIGCQSVYRQ